MYTYCKWLIYFCDPHLRNTAWLTRYVTPDGEAETFVRHRIVEGTLLRGTSNTCKHHCHRTQPPGQWRLFVISCLEIGLTARAVTAILRLWRFSGTVPRTSCVLHHHSEPGPRSYAMRPLSEQDLVPLYASPTVVINVKSIQTTPCQRLREQHRQCIHVRFPDINAPNGAAVLLYSVPFPWAVTPKFRSKYGDEHMLSGN